VKHGKTISELAKELEAQQARKQDYVIDSRELHVLTGEAGTEVVLPGVAELQPQQLFHRQLGTHIGVRADLYDRLRGKHPAQFDGLVNGLLGRVHLENNGKALRRMVRTFTDGGEGGQGLARCLLSDRYRRLDNHPLAEAVLPIIAEIPDVEIPACEVTETRMYIKVVAPNTGVNLKDLIEPGKHRFLPEGPDTVQAGFVITNSEVGAAALSVEHMLFRLVCTNGLIVGKALRRTHVGRQVGVGEDYSIYSDETLIADDKALMLKVRDAVRAAVDFAKFEQLARQFAATATSSTLEDPVRGMEVLGQRLGLSEGEQTSVLRHLIEGRDLTQFGAINAVTRTATDVESYDRSIELEQLGNDIMQMSVGEWDRVAAAVPA
jgi:hypothetical protein